MFQETEKKGRKNENERMVGTLQEKKRGKERTLKNRERVCSASGRMVERE